MANATFSKLDNVWRDKKLSLYVKVQLYKTLVLSVLLYSVETWFVTVSNVKRLKEAHPKWQRKISRITWKEQLTNENVRQRTGTSKMEHML
jgi:hypothetical protein